MTASPTDSLVKNSSVLPIQHTSNNEFHKDAEQQNHDHENSAFQIMQLINERKTFVYQAKQVKSGGANPSPNVDYDMYQFSLYNSGGLIEIPKYSAHILVPDDVCFGEISVGICKANTENILELSGDRTPLSAVILVKTSYGSHNNYPKPIVISMDHSAVAAALEQQWETSVYHKASSDSDFVEIDDQTVIYSKVVANKCFIMSDRDGMYALVGRPSARHHQHAHTLKEMKYAIVLADGALKVFLAQNTRAHTEALNEEIQKSNGKIVKMPELFELHFPRQTNLESSFLNLDIHVNYNNNNSIINSDATCRKIRMADVWNSSCDFIEIEIPVTINGSFKTTTTSNNAAHKRRHGSFDLKVSLELENKTLFSYSNMNANTHELHTANCNQQEFYSSVSVNPVYIPLQ